MSILRNEATSMSQTNIYFIGNLNQENKEKEKIIDNKLIELEKDLAELEFKIKALGIVDFNSNITTLVNRRYYDELEKIDELIVKLDYFDPKTKNLYLDEIDERVVNLYSQINRAIENLSTEVQNV